MLPPNSFLDPTKVGQFPGEPRERGIRRILSPRETPPGLANATDPTPDDLVPVYADYRIMPGDIVAVSIHDLIQTGVPYSATMEVSSSGEIRIPELGSIKVAGLTEREVEQELSARLKESSLLPRPVVVVNLQGKRGRVFHIVGAVRASGAYPITDPDMRLLEAIGMAGDADALAKRAYIIRRESRGVGSSAEQRRPAAVQEGWVIPPPEEEPPGPATLTSAMAMLGQEAGPLSTTQPPSREELADVMTQARGQTQPATAETGPARPFQPLIIFDPQTGALLPVEAEVPKAPEPPVPKISEEEKLEEPFDWEAVEEVGPQQRVIAIDMSELKAGNPRYNVVIRDRDVISVPVDTGIFYVMGEVNRPGVYAFGGRDITVKQALAICGGFSQLAWPQRCELIRKEPGTDKQFTRTVNLDAIFAGLEDDFYLRDDDILNVGTHIVAPFLFVIRNSFRFTYGFGFVYDRNFADVDSYGSKLNPDYVKKQRRAQRGLPF